MAEQPAVRPADPPKSAGRTLHARVRVRARQPPVWAITQRGEVRPCLCGGVRPPSSQSARPGARPPPGAHATMISGIDASVVGAIDEMHSGLQAGTSRRGGPRDGRAAGAVPGDRADAVDRTRTSRCDSHCRSGCLQTAALQDERPPRFRCEDGAVREDPSVGAAYHAKPTAETWHLSTERGRGPAAT
jgi:hypothetical protein